MTRRWIFLESDTRKAGRLRRCVDKRLGMSLGEKSSRTLQKSMLLTPLLPRAGPTGGDGDA